jgi:hypothetical protein
MTANDFTAHAATLPNPSTAAANAVTGNAGVAKEVQGGHETTSRDFADDLETALAQLTNAVGAPLVEASPYVDFDSTDDGLIDSATTDRNNIGVSASAVSTSAAIPWELLLAGAAVAPCKVDSNGLVVSKDAAGTRRDGDLVTGLPTAALPADFSSNSKASDQTRLMVADMQVLLRPDASVSDRAEQPQVRDRNAFDGAGMLSALAAAAVEAKQLEPANEQPRLRAHVGASAWANELGAKLTWMTERGMQSASLLLSPEHLGPLEIRISVDKDQASVWFGATHAETRIALEQALPRLRELFASQGLNLADAGVFREPPRQQQSGYRAEGDSLHTGSEQKINAVTLRLHGTIDAYA